MLSKGIKYAFDAVVWKYAGPSGWYFVSLPEKFAIEIRENFQGQEQGWGRLKANAQIGESAWDTAIWFDTKMNTYLLPVKAEIRKKEKLAAGMSISVNIWV